MLIWGRPGARQVRAEVVGQMAQRYSDEGIFDEDRIMRRLPNKFRKALLLSMYKPQLVRCAMAYSYNPCGQSLMQL